MSLNMKLLPHEGYERVIYFTDDNDFHCFISIHNLKLGPALGGCRLKNYKTHDDALLDALRLSKGMTYKSAAAGLNLGGGKGVIIAPKATRDIMLRFGEAINMLNGDYVSGEDVGTTLSDIQIAGEITQYVVHQDGSSMTARGVLSAMKAAWEHKGHFGSPNVWVQGLGKVGMDLAYRLKDFSNCTIVSDLRQEAMKEAIDNLNAIEYNRQKDTFIEIYSPCAMGQVITSDNVDSIEYDIICGSANNQLIDDGLAHTLIDRGILYCPDYIVNAGGVIDAACEIGQPYNQTQSEMMTDLIGERLTVVFEMAEDEKITTVEAANKLAEERFM